MIKKKSKLFVNELIPKVSRTFALAIKFLPPELRHPVFSAYLLCRLADTIEDTPYIKATEKSTRLKHLKNLLDSAVAGDPISPEKLVPLYREIDPLRGDDHQLLGRSVELFEVLNEIPIEKRRIIYRWAGEMSGGMAEFSSLKVDEDNHIRALSNIKEWDRYCYYVAGTVGRMMTELFIEHYEINDGRSGEMKRLCDSFGLGLQKVNTIKDVTADTLRGVVFLPLDIMKKYKLSPDKLPIAGHNDAKAAFVNELLDIASTHLDDAVEYTALLSERLWRVRMFLIVPVLLAQATINALAKFPIRALEGPPVKIARLEVTRLTAAARQCSRSNKVFRRYFQKLKDKRI